MLLSSWLTSVYRRMTPRPTTRRRVHSRTAAAGICCVERLEPRVMLSAAAVGTETQVNTTVTGDQVTNPNGGAIAMSATGDYVVTWTGSGQDGSGLGVYAQRYNALGVAQGSEIQVNTTTTGDQSDPTVAMDAAGNFVVTWTSAGQDGDGNGVYAQRFNALGIAQGAEIQVNTTTTGDQNGSVIGMDAAGNFVIAWTSAGQDGNLDGVFAQRFDATGVAQGGEIAVNTTTTGDQSNPTIAVNATGSFVVAWTSAGQDGSLNGVVAQRFDAAGVAQGGEIQVNTTTTGDQQDPSVAIDALGNFVVTWTSDAQDGDGAGIYAQLYNSLGVAQGTEVQVNTTTVGAQTSSSVAMDALGNFVVTWSSDGQDGSLGGIYGQLYTSTGLAVGTEFLVNATTAGNQLNASVAANAVGDFTVALTSDGQDTAGLGVFAQQFELTATVTLPGGPLLYTEGNAATAINAGVTVSDPDNTTLASAQVSITNYVAGQDVLAFTNDGSTMGNIAVASNTGGVLTLTSAGGTATTAEWQAALRSVTYANTSSNPTTTTRNVTYTVNDGVADSTAATTAINITALDNAPVLTVAGNINFVENGVAAAIDSGLTVSDVDSTTLASATVTISNYVAGQDVLAFTNDGSTMGNIAISSNAGGVLTLTSAGSTATTAEWQAALRAVTYVNTSDNPTVTARTIDFVVNDGTTDSAALTSTVNISAVNDATVIAGIETGFLPYAPNAAATAVSSTLQLSDLDNTTLTGATVTISGYKSGDLLQFTDTANITGSFDTTTGVLTLTGSDTVANYQAALRSVTYVSTSLDASARTIGFQVNDGTDLSNVSTRVVGGILQLVGTTLNVYGTADVDVITISEDTNLTIVRDGQTFLYSPGSVTAVNVYGGASADTVVVNSIATGTTLQVLGEAGNDTLRVAAGVTAGVTLNGGDGNDLLIGGGGNDTLIGGIGNDYLNAGGGSNTIIGGVGDDVYTFTDATVNQLDTVVELAGEGTDLLNFGAITSAVNANLTSDTALATMSHRIVQAGVAGQAANFENVNGGSANDFITGNALANVIYGNDGNDTLNGGDGSDQLNGGIGNDLLIGGNQNDILIGGIGDDYLKGLAGADVLIGGDGFNTLVGGLGDDTYSFAAALTNQMDTVVELADEGTDLLDFASLTTAVTADLTSDTSLAIMDHRIVQTGGSGQAANIESVAGGSANDHLTGNAAANVLMGNGGNDTLIGNAGNDILVGGDGNDLLKGISGTNILIGGLGADLLQGGTGDDLLLSGSYQNQGNAVVLNTLLSEWTQATAYDTRVNHLLSLTGGLNDGLYLDSTTTTNDNSADYVTGNAGTDFYLASSTQDSVTDKATDEIFTQIDSWI